MVMSSAVTDTMCYNFRSYFPLRILDVTYFDQVWIFKTDLQSLENSWNKDLTMMAKQQIVVMLWAATSQRRTSEFWAVVYKETSESRSWPGNTHEMEDLTMYSWTEFPSVYHTHRRPHNLRITIFVTFECIQIQCSRLFKTIKIMVSISDAISLKAFYNLFFHMYGCIGWPPLVPDIRVAMCMQVWGRFLLHLIYRAQFLSLIHISEPTRPY